MNTPKQYNIIPARGQALLNFQGRRFPEKIDVYETEIIEEVRNTKDKEQTLFEKKIELNSDFQNLLIQGDCLSACAYLKSQNVKVDLVYIDPPFASGANYAKKIYLRKGISTQVETDDNTIGDEIMYGDIWQKEDYLNWLYERLLAVNEVMTEDSSIFLHLDWHSLRLFRNPAQTTAKIFSIIDGFKTSSELGLNEFWDGGIAQNKGFYTPVKFSGIHDKLTKELLDVYLEEIYKLEDTSNKASEIIIIYAHKEIEIDQHYMNQQISKAAKTDLKVKLVSLDSLLGEKRDALFAPDNADIKVAKQGNKYKVEIKKYFSPYLKNKIDDFNAKKTKKGTVEQDLSKAVKISKEGLELIESVQFDTILKKTWKSDLELEDKAGIKEKIKGSYILNTDKFKIKIRNITGDEIIIDSKDIL